MKPAPLRLERPRSLEEALGAAGRARRRRQGHRRRAEPRAAAQLPARRAGSARRPRPGAGAGDIDVADGTVRVGALCTQRALERHAGALAPARCWRRAALRGARGDPQPRHRGWLHRARRCRGGAAAVLQTLGGEVEVDGRRRARAIAAAEEFFVSHLTSCLEPDEIVTEVRFPALAAAGARASPRSRRATAITRCAPSPARCAVEGGVVGEAASARARSPTGRCACPRPPRMLAGSRCEPRRCAAAAEAAARGRAERRPARLRRVPAALTGVLVSARAQRAPTRWGGRERALAHGQRPPRARARRGSHSCCRTSCGTPSACAAPTSAASTASAAPARCSSTAAPCAPA